MRVNKGTAWLITEAILFIMFMAVLIGDNTPNKIIFAAIAPIIIQAEEWLTIAFLGWNVADNGVKGKFFRQELVEPPKEDA